MKTRCLMFIIANIIYLPYSHGEGTPDTSKIQCTATVEENSDNRFFRSEKMSAKRFHNGYYIHEVEMESRFFSVHETHIEGEAQLVAYLTTAPEYTKGFVTTGTLNAAGEFKASEVNGPRVYKIRCLRK